MLQNRRLSLAIGGALLTVLWLLGLGCTQVSLLREDSMGIPEFYNVTWIPWLVLGLAAMGCLALLGVLKPLPKGSPWDYAPALALGLILCIGTSSPLLWAAFDPGWWNVPHTWTFLYALYAAAFAYLLLRGETRGLRFDGKRALLLVGLLALAYAPRLLSEAADWIGGNLISANNTSPYRVAGWIASALFLLGGAMALLVARRGRRGAGAFLVILAAVCLALYLLVAYNVLPYGWPENEGPQALRVLQTRFYDGLMIWNSMSAYGFVLFAGIKCLLPEKRDDVHEIDNYIQAMDYGVHRIVEDGFPFSTRFLRELHSILLRGVRGEHKTPGEFRRSQNFIGGTKPSDAIYVPPAIPDMDDALNDFDRFMNRNDDTPVLIRLAIMHYQFETIHPFLDGNGRIQTCVVKQRSGNTAMDESMAALVEVLKRSVVPVPPGGKTVEVEVVMEIK